VSLLTVTEFKILPGTIRDPLKLRIRLSILVTYWLPVRFTVISPRTVGGEVCWLDLKVQVFVVVVIVTTTLLRLPSGRV
jgi:hypothetical protein